MKKILFTLLLLPVLAFAQAGELVLGELTVEYETVMEKDTSTLYFQGDEMVVSRHGDLWVVYEDDKNVLEAYDTTGNGEPDTFITLDTNGAVAEVTGTGADRFALPEVVEFDELLAVDNEKSEATVSETEDLVGDLDSIKIPRYHNYYLYAFSVIFVGVTYWWWRRRKSDK